jgi:hypothetical protein
MEKKKNRIKKKDKARNMAFFHFRVNALFRQCANPSCAFDIYFAAISAQVAMLFLRNSNTIRLNPNIRNELLDYI